jgi:arylsulfatase A-like enzyme
MQNIILIILDTLRRDRLSAYGSGRETSPHFDAFAAEHTRFARAVAPAQWTIPAHGSLFTGLMPSEHHVTQANSRLADDVPTLAEQLRAAGYHTTAFCNNALVGVVNHGLQRGFDRFYNYASAVPYRPGDVHKPWLRREASRRFRPTARRIGNWFAQSETLFRLSLKPLFVPVWTRYINFKGHTGNSISDLIAYWDAHHAGGSDQPLFAFVNLMGAHLPYQPPQDAINHVAPHLKQDRRAYDFVHHFNRDGAAWASPPEPPLTDWQQQALLDFYDAEIFAQDQHIGRLLAHLKATGALDNTTVIIAADHGEGHGEHDLFGHGFGVHQELVHVPLAIASERLPRSATVEANVSTRQLHSTMLEAAGIEPGDGAVPSLFQAQNPALPVLSEAFPPLTFVGVLEHRNPSIIERMLLLETRRCVVHEDHKLMLRGEQPVALYDIASDPAETRNLLRTQPDRAALLARMAGAAVSEWRSDAEAEQDQQVLEHLRVLGYID